MAYISQINLGNVTYDIKAKALDSDILAANDAMLYKGTLPANYSSTVTSYYTPAANCGWTYKVSNVCNINGIYCEVGDVFICLKDNTVAATSNNYSTIMANWTVIQTNLTSAVIAATGTPVTITSSVNYTPDGEVSKPEFTGTGAKFTFTGTAAEHTHSIPSLGVSGNYDKVTSVTTNGTKSVNGTLSHTATEVAIS